MEHKKTNSTSILPLCFAAISIFLMIVFKIAVNFGAVNNIFFGVFSIFILTFPFVGAILSYIKNRDIKSLDFVINTAVIILALIVL